MSISTTIQSMQTHTSNAYTMIGYGTDLTGINKNLENLSSTIFEAFLEALRTPDTLFTNLPKVSGTGTNITLNDTANAPMRIELGATELEQETTTGKNKFNGNAVSTTSPTNWGITFENNVLTIEHKTSYTTGSPNVVIGTLQSGNYTISYTSQSKMSLYVDGAYDQILDNGETFTAESNKTYSLYFSVADNSTETFTNVQLESGSTATDYEPYTGGNPAPNPDFPMPIHTISGDNEILVRNKNLFSGYTKGIGLSGTTGAQIADANGATSDYIPLKVRENNKYKIWGLPTTISTFVAGYNKDKVFVGRTGGLTLGELALAPQFFTGGTPQGTGDIEYVRVTTYKISTSTGTIDDVDNAKVMLEAGTTATSYEPHQEQTAQLNLPVENLFDKNGTFTDGFLSYLGVIQASANYKITDFMSIQPNTSYITSGGNLGTNPSRCYYDKDKNFISGIVHNGVTEFVDVSPNNAYYMKESIPIVALDTIQIEKGTKANSYTPFGTPALEYCKIGNYEDEFVIPSGKNLFGGFTFSKTSSNVDFTYNTGGIIIANGTASANASSMSLAEGQDNHYITLEAGTYYLKGGKTSDKAILVLNTSGIQLASDTGSGATFTLNETTNVFVRCYIVSGQISNNESYYVQISKTNIEYTPYNPDGKWYLKKNILEKTLNGSEPDWSNINSGCFKLSNFINGYDGSQSAVHTILCDRLIAQSQSNIYAKTSQGIAVLGGNTNALYIHINSTDDLDTFKTLLSTNNYKVKYLGLNPEYILLNDTLQSQLEYIYNQMLAYKGQTNISQVNNDLPFDMVATALKDLE